MVFKLGRFEKKDLDSRSESIESCGVRSIDSWFQLST